MVDHSAPAAVAPPRASVPEEFMVPFFAGDPANASQVVFFEVVDRLTSLHRSVRRVLMVSSLGTVYLCHLDGIVTHSMPLADQRRKVHVDMDAQPSSPSGRGDDPTTATAAAATRSLLIRYSDDVHSSTVLTVPEPSVRRLVAVLRYFLGPRLRLTKADDVKAAVTSGARDSLLARWGRAMMKKHSGDAVEHRALRAARSVAGSMAGRPPPPPAALAAASAPQLRHRSSTRVAGAAVAPSDVLVATPSTDPASTTPAASAEVPSEGRDRRREDLKRRIRRIYEHYCPERLPMLESVLAKYANHEEEVLAAMVLKYGPEPHPTAPSSSAGVGSDSRARAATAAYNHRTSNSGDGFTEDRARSLTTGGGQPQQRDANDDDFLAGAATDTTPSAVAMDGGGGGGTMDRGDFDIFTAQRVVLSDHVAALTKDIAELTAQRALADQSVGCADPDAAFVHTRRQADALCLMVLRICDLRRQAMEASDLEVVSAQVQKARRERQARLDALFFDD